MLEEDRILRINTLKKVNFEYAFLLLSLILTIAGVILVFNIFLGYQEKVYEKTFEFNGLKIEQNIYSDNAQKASRNVQNSIESALLELSLENKDSQISKLNNNAGKEWVEISSGVFSILSKSLEVCSKTDGIFDITVLPLFESYQKKIKTNGQLNREDLQDLKNFVGYKNLKLNQDVLRAKLLKEGAKVGLDLISSGSCCVLALNEYRKMGVQAGFIKVGNSAGVWGAKKKLDPFKFQIVEAPVDSRQTNNNDTAIIVNLYSGCISTKFASNETVLLTDKENFGSVAKNEIASATVIHENGTVSDALALACLAAGKDESFKLLSKFDAKGILVLKDKKILISQSIEKKSVEVANNYFLIEQEN